MKGELNSTISNFGVNTGVRQDDKKIVFSMIVEGYLTEQVRPKLFLGFKFTQLCTTLMTR